MNQKSSFGSLQSRKRVCKTRYKSSSKVSVRFFLLLQTHHYLAVKANMWQRGGRMPVATTERVTSSFKLSGLLESAIPASNAPYDDPYILDRMKVKMIPHHSGDKGWDVFSLEYNSRDPLNTIFTESMMARYLKIFNFLWNLIHVEHALCSTW